VYALGVVVLANLVFLGLRLAVQVDPDVIATRIRKAFETNDLTDQDYLPFDARRGYFQRNDCVVLQMLANRNPSRLDAALAPTVFSENDMLRRHCAVLRSLLLEAADRSVMYRMRYARYWHGYNPVAASVLRFFDLRVLRRALSAVVWLAIGILAVAAFRSGRRVRRAGLAVAATAAAFWAVPYFAPGLTQGPGDALLLLALVPLAVWPRIAMKPDTIGPYAAAFGATVVFFEMFTGQIPTGAVWLAAMTLAARRDRGPQDGSTTALVLAAVAAYGLGAAGTVILKQGLAIVVADVPAGGPFVGHLREYMQIPASQGRWPGILLPFLSLVKNARTLTYGSRLAGYGLVAANALAWIAAAALGWRSRHTERGRDVLTLVVASLIPVAWTLLFLNHTYVHAWFMVRMLVGPIALSALALSWSVGDGLREERLPRPEPV
jgi:hypothetical protein